MLPEAALHDLDDLVVISALSFLHGLLFALLIREVLCRGFPISASKAAKPVEDASGHTHMSQFATGQHVAPRSVRQLCPARTISRDLAHKPLLQPSCLPSTGKDLHFWRSYSR